MKILVQKKGENGPLTVSVPVTLAMNPVTAAMVSGKSELSYRQASLLFRSFRDCAALLDGKPFVEVEEADGDRVTVFL